MFASSYFSQLSQTFNIGKYVATSRSPHMCNVQCSMTRDNIHFIDIVCLYIKMTSSVNETSTSTQTDTNDTEDS